MICAGKNYISPPVRLTATLSVNQGKRFAKMNQQVKDLCETNGFALKAACWCQILCNLLCSITFQCVQSTRQVAEKATHDESPSILPSASCGGSSLLQVVCFCKGECRPVGHGIRIQIVGWPRASKKL